MNRRQFLGSVVGVASWLFLGAPLQERAIEWSGVMYITVFSNGDQKLYRSTKHGHSWEQVHNVTFVA